MEKLKQNTSRLHWWKRGEIKVRGEESGERENRKKKRSSTVKGQVATLVNSSRSGMSRVIRHEKNELYLILSGVAKKLPRKGRQLFPSC